MFICRLIGNKVEKINGVVIADHRLHTGVIKVRIALAIHCAYIFIAPFIAMIDKRILVEMYWDNKSWK